MNPIIEEILSSRKTVSPNGEELHLSSEITRKDGAFIHRIINQDSSIKKTLEIGCANGVSSLHICEALKDRDDSMHTIIDPFQSTDWKRSGVYALERAGFKDFRLIEDLSEIAMPALLKEEENQYDFIFIDGWHTFDHVMVDCFYATRLLKVGGFMLMDDTNVAPVAKVAKYFTNYPCYEHYASTTNYPEDPVLNTVCRTFSLLPVPYDLHCRLPRKLQKAIRYPSVTALKKISDDQRSWHWYQPF